MSLSLPRWRRNGLWLAFVAVILSLAGLLVVQYRTLRRLQDVSETARRAMLNNYLGTIVSDVRTSYVTTAETVLNVPVGGVDEAGLPQLTKFWGQADLDGIRKLFLVDMKGAAVGDSTWLRFFDPATKTLVNSVDSRDSAIWQAAITWVPTATMSGTGGMANRLRVDERVPGYRLIMKPIFGDSGQLAGLAGMALDEDYFQRIVLPIAIQNSLPTYFSDPSRNDLMVRIRDSKGHVIMGSRKTEVAGQPEKANFPFVFRDWTLEIQSATPAATQLLQANFALWLTLSLLVAGVLAVAIALALSAAARTMKLSEMKTDFVSNVSHELRTPVASIRVFGELLRRGRVQSPEKVQQYGATIETEARRLSDLIDNVLDFARIESGQKAYRPVRGDLVPMVTEVVEAFQVRLLESGHEIVVQMPQNSLPLVEIDPEALSLALNNLLDNAVKYSGDSRRVFLRLLSDSGAAVVEVEDEGIGIPEDEQAKIFERFHRVGTGSVHDVKGSGLGLAIVHHIMKAHHGRVVVESAPGEGSTFRLIFPAARGEPVAGANTEILTARRTPVVEPDPRVERG